MSNTITAYFKGRVGVAESVYQNDYGIVMVFDSIDLPAHFDCYFSVPGSDTSTAAIGADNRVVIPNSVLGNSGSMTVHIPLHTGENDSEVEYVVYFKVIGRARPEDDGTPTQMTAIERALALLSQPITNIEEIVNEALSFTGDTFAEMKQELQDDFDNYTETLEGDLATWKGGVESDFDNLEAQFDTAVAAVTTDTEVTNIRVGDDNVIYTTAGEAVRKQFADVKSAFNQKKFTWKRGYYNGNTGAYQWHEYFICTDGYLDTSIYKRIEVFTQIENISSVFFTVYNGNTVVENVSYDASAYGDISYVCYNVPENITKVYVNILRSSQKIELKDAGKVNILLTGSQKTSGYEFDFEKIEWLQGNINSSTGAYNSGSNRHIVTRDYIRVNPQDTIDVRISNTAQDCNFYIIGYETKFTLVGLLTRDNYNPQAFEVTGFDGFIRICIYNTSTTIAPSDGKNAITIQSAVDAYAKTLDDYIANGRNYVSEQDYFEESYDHADIVWVAGRYINQYGVMAYNADAAVTGMLRVEAGAYYQTNNFINKTIDCRLTYYDEDYNWVGTLAFYTSQVTFKMPDNCHYVRINMNINHCKDLTFVRANHINDAKFSRNDDRIFVSRWFTNRYTANYNVETLSSTEITSDYVAVDANSKYAIVPQSSIFMGVHNIREYNSDKIYIGDATSYELIDASFKTSSNTAFVRINGVVDDFKSASCYIKKVFDKDLDALTFTLLNGYYDGGDGDFRSRTMFLCTSSPIDTSVQKTIDVYKPNTLDLTSIFFTLYDANGVVRNISYNYNLSHLRFEVPSHILQVHVNMMSDHDISPTDAEDVQICLSNDSDRTHFNVVDYVESNAPKMNAMLNASSRSNPLPIGVDYNAADMSIAFTKEDVSSSIITRGLDAPCVFWDSIMRRWGITFTGYRHDGVSEYGSIYAAHSDDLINWVQDGVIIERSIDDPYAPDYGSVGGSYVFIQNGVYHVFYNGGSVRGFESGKYSINLATGTSLSNLTKHPDNPILVGRDDGEWYAYDRLYRPVVVQWGDGTYYMFMNAGCAHESTGGKVHENLGFATSKDLIHWTMQGQLLKNIPENAYDQCVTGDPCFYDVGDATLYTCFNVSGQDWSKTGVGIIRTPKSSFPVGWEMVKNNQCGPQKVKSYVVYKDRVQYAFMADTAPAIFYRTSTI